MVISLPRCNINDMRISEIIQKCIYGLLSFQEFGDCIDSSKQPDSTVRAIASMITLVELKEYLATTFQSS